MNLCPECHEWTEAVWYRLRDVPGCRPSFWLRHRRANKVRCVAIRGERLDGSDAYTPGMKPVTITDSSRSECADERATA